MSGWGRSLVQQKTEYAGNAGVEMSGNKLWKGHPIYGGNWWPMYKGLVKPCEGDWNLIAVLSYLLDQQKVFLDSGKQPDGDGLVFYCTEESITEWLGLKRFAVHRCIADLQAAGILISKLKGLPARKWYVINLEILENYIKTEKSFVGSGAKLVGWQQTSKQPDSKPASSLAASQHLLNHTLPNQTPISKEITRGIPAAAQAGSASFFSEEVSDDFVPQEIFKSIIDTGIFVNSEYNRTHPSKELVAINDIIQKIRHRTFLSGTSWKVGWPEKEIDFGGLLPRDSGEGGLVHWDEIVSMVIHAASALQESWDNGFDWPSMMPDKKRRQKINLRNFLVNDRNPLQCTSMFLTFLYSPLKEELKGMWMVVRSQLPNDVATKMDKLYKEEVASGSQPEWTYQAKYTYYNAGLELVEWYNAFKERILACSENQFDVCNRSSFFSLVIQYIEVERVTGGLRWEFLTPKSPHWERFVNLVRYQEKVELEPSATKEAKASALRERERAAVHRERVSRKAEELKKTAEEACIPIPSTEELYQMAEKALGKEDQWALEDAG